MTAAADVIESKKIHGIALDDVRKQSTSWLKGVRRVLARVQASGEDFPDFHALRKEVNEELEKCASAGTWPPAQVTQTESEKVREIR